jgi:hypothetical protein
VGGIVDENRQTTAERAGDAETMFDELSAALVEAGITLPSLGIDRPSCDSAFPCPLIDLGRCNLDTARALASVLRRGCASA